MLVICPRCKVKLRVADEKIADEGKKFRCPRCSAVLLVKKPVSLLKPVGEEQLVRQTVEQEIIPPAIITEPIVGEKVIDERIEKAKRLARTIIADIYLYSRAKAEEAIKNDTFDTVFAAEIKEGIKLYEGKIPAEVRASGDFLNEAINNFIEKKKRELF